MDNQPPDTVTDKRRVKALRHLQREIEIMITLRTASETLAEVRDIGAVGLSPIYFSIIMAQSTTQQRLRTSISNTLTDVFYHNMTESAAETVIINAVRVAVAEYCDGYGLSARAAAPKVWEVLHGVRFSRAGLKKLHAILL